MRSQIRLRPSGRVLTTLGCLAFLGGCLMPDADDPGAEDPGAAADVPGLVDVTDQINAAAACAAPTSLSFFPVRGRHDTGYQRTPHEPNVTSKWTCNQDYTNPDFRNAGCSNPDSHYGIDIWAAEGTPVVATVSGTIVEARYDSYSGNIVTIRDSCGWYHFSIHLKSIASGIAASQSVRAGKVIGYVGKTGSASGGVIHLHYSIYPAAGFCSGINPHPYLKAVEWDVCWTPQVCGGSVCSKNQFCSGTRCCPSDRCVAGCPCPF